MQAWVPAVIRHDRMRPVPRVVSRISTCMAEKVSQRTIDESMSQE